MSQQAQVHRLPARLDATHLRELEESADLAIHPQRGLIHIHYVTAACLFEPVAAHKLDRLAAHAQHVQRLAQVMGNGMVESLQFQVGGFQLGGVRAPV